MVGMSALSLAVTLPYSTSFETTEVPAWGSPNPATNVNWSGLNNWRVSTNQKFSGNQSLYATTNGTALLPSTTIQTTSIPNTQNQGQIRTSMKMYMESTAGSFGTTSTNNVHGFRSRITWNSGISSRSIRTGIQNNGNVVLWSDSSFTYSTIGTIANFSTYRDQWLDLVLDLDTTSPQVSYLLTIKDSNNAQLFSGSGNILSTSVTGSRVDFTAVVAVANGAGGPMGAYYDNFKVEAVPEPATLTVLGLGAAALLRRRKK